MIQFVILCVSLVIFVFVMIKFVLPWYNSNRSQNQEQNTPEPPQPILPAEPEEDRPQPESEEAIEQQMEQEVAALFDAPLPAGEKYVEAPFITLFDAAIITILRENTIGTGRLQTVLNTGYHQAQGLIDHMITVGIIEVDPRTESEYIAVSKEQYALILRKDLLNYSQSLSVDEVIAKFAKDVALLKSGFWTDIDHMNGPQFEQWCAELLRSLHYENVEVTKGSGDQGVDITAKKEDVIYAFQCKCISNHMGNTAIQEVYAGARFYNCHVGVVIINRYFTSGAIQLAKATGVILWDRDKIKELIERVNDEAMLKALEGKRRKVTRRKKEQS